MTAAFNLEHALAYRMNRAGVLIGQLMSDELKRDGLTLMMWRVLVSLFHNDSQTLTELADHTSVELYTVSRVVAELARKAWIEREPCGADRRAIRVRLASAGRAITLRYMPIAQGYEDAALAGMKPQDVLQLKQQLERIYQNLTAVAASRSAAQSAGAAAGSRKRKQNDRRRYLRPASRKSATGIRQ